MGSRGQREKGGASPIFSEGVNAPQASPIRAITVSLNRKFSTSWVSIFVATLSKVSVLYIQMVETFLCGAFIQFLFHLICICQINLEFLPSSSEIYLQSLTFYSRIPSTQLREYQFFIGSKNEVGFLVLLS